MPRKKTKPAPDVNPALRPFIEALADLIVVDVLRPKEPPPPPRELSEGERGFLDFLVDQAVKRKTGR